MSKFRKKPVVIDAILWDGKLTSLSGLGNYEAMLGQDLGDTDLIIETLEGTMRANVGDYVIKGVKGEIYPCKPDIFAMTYEMDGRSETEILRNRLQQAEQDRDSYKEQMIHAQMALHDAKGVKRPPQATSDGVQ